VNELALFAGAGGGILGGKLLGWRTVCAVEWEPYPASVLCARQNDGLLPTFPIWDDVRTFDGKPWQGIVDVVSGGFPCQDISAAGHGAGISGNRSGLWSEMARIIGEVRPRYAFVENSPVLTSRGLGTVLGDLAALGFDARWGVISAADVGAPHLRERIWIIATNTRYKQPGQQKGGFRQERNESVGQIISDICANLSDAGNTRLQRGEQLQNDNRENISRQTSPHGSIAKRNNDGRTNSNWWASEPNVGRVAHGVAARVDRLKAIGNGQVPAVVATAFRLLGGFHD